MGGGLVAGGRQPRATKKWRDPDRAPRVVFGLKKLRNTAQRVGANRSARRQDQCADGMRSPRGEPASVRAQPRGVFTLLAPDQPRGVFALLERAQPQAALGEPLMGPFRSAPRRRASLAWRAKVFSLPPQKKSEKGRQNERWPSAHLKGLRPNQPQRLPPPPQKTNELSKIRRESTREVLMPFPVGFVCSGVKKQGKVCDKG